jgi:uncharacterized protein (DUF1697 family)
MPVCIGLLRAVNVGGANPLGMESLRTLLSRMGFDEVRTLLQSGNIVFRSEARVDGDLEGRLEERIATDLGVRTDFFLRTADEWGSVVSLNPFVREAKTDPGRLLVTALKNAPSEEAWKRLNAAIKDRERVRGVGRHAYIVYPDGTGRSRLTPAVIEKNLETRGTSRNWNTVTKLLATASGL